MTSRVQKGGTVFRPVAKSRPRAPPSASRQASLAIEGTISLPGADALPPTQSSSSLYSAQEGQHGGISNHETASLTLTGFPHGGATIDDVNVAPSMPPRQPTVPPIIGSSSTEGMRSRSAVPTVIATPRAPMQKIFQPASQSSSAKAIAPPEKHLSAEPAPLQSSIVPIPYDTNASSIPESSCSPSTSTNSNSTTQIPDASKFAPKAAPRKRKISARSAKEPKQRASASIDAEDVENVQEGSSTKKPRSRASSRASSSTPKLRRRAPSPPVYDPDADPGEDLDPTSVTMAELCSDTGQGRVSRKAAEILSNHAAWKARNREKRARMRQIMEAKKYGREAELENEEQGEGQADPKTPVNEAGSSNVAILDDTGNGFDYSQDLTTSRFNVQVRIGPNGETVIDEESLVVDRAENDGTESYTHVIESDQTKFVNSGSYGKRYRGSRWSAEETELFYDALSQYGENYELIAFILPGRDRKSCKNKFKIEDKRNPARINYCLNNSIPVDMKTLSRMTGKDFSGPVPEIRVPPPPPLVPGEGDKAIGSTENTSPSVKKRSRSKSRGATDSGVVVLGDAETFEG